LPSPAPPTLFARFGNALSFAFALLLAAAGLFVLRRSRGRAAAPGAPSGIAEPAKAR
jgi:hypothetical protein